MNITVNSTLLVTKPVNSEDPNTVDGKNRANQLRFGSLSPLFTTGFIHPRWWSPDFFHQRYVHSVSGDASETPPSIAISWLGWVGLGFQKIFIKWPLPQLLRWLPSIHTSNFRNERIDVGTGFAGLKGDEKGGKQLASSRYKNNSQDSWFKILPKYMSSFPHCPWQ